MYKRLNDYADFDSWASDITKRCEEYACVNNYKFSFARFSPMEQLNVRFMNPRNGKRESFDFDYTNSKDHNIVKVMKYIMTTCEILLGNCGNYFNEFKKWMPEEEKESLSVEAFGEVVSNFDVLRKVFGLNL